MELHTIGIDLGKHPHVTFCGCLNKVGGKVEN